jgi:protein phosphatase PTC7
VQARNRRAKQAGAPPQPAGLLPGFTPLHAWPRRPAPTSALYPHHDPRAPPAQGYDLPWWEKLLGVRYREGRLQLKQLTGGKMDDITVLVACVEEEEVAAASGQQHGAAAQADTANGVAVDQQQS